MISRIFTTCIFFSLVAQLAFSVNASQTTPVTINGVKHQLAQPLYLNDLWQHLDAPERVYWPAAALYVGDADILLLQQQLLQKLAARAELLRHDNKTEYAVAVNHFSDWLAKLKLGRRVQVVLDYERSRHVKAANPLLQNNHFYLSAKPATQSVELIGAVTRSVYEFSMAVPVIDASQLHSQFAAVYADNSWLYWSVGGDWQRSGIAYWNHNQKLQFSAGSSIFIPFSTAVLGDDAEWINSQVLTILQSRIR